jgi:hypothetical protein
MGFFLAAVRSQRLAFSQTGSRLWYGAHPAFVSTGTIILENAIAACRGKNTQPGENRNRSPG